MSYLCSVPNANENHTLCGGNQFGHVCVSFLEFVLNLNENFAVQNLIKYIKNIYLNQSTFCHYFRQSNRNKFVGVMSLCLAAISRVTLLLR